MNEWYVLSAKELHAKQREDDNEEKNQQQQRHYGLHAVEKREDEITQRSPISADDIFNDSARAPECQKLKMMS